jgi:hypothetical protein
MITVSMPKARAPYCISALCLIIVLLSASDAFAASCIGRSRFCDNCDTVITFFTKKNTTCTVQYTVNTGAVYSQKVIKKPRGVYGTASVTAGAYQPPPSFVGEDYFEVEVSYDRSGNRYKTVLKVTVKVSE